MGTVIERLLRQSHLFDDPSAYEAGVRDTLEALAMTSSRPEPVVHTQRAGASA